MNTNDFDHDEAYERMRRADPATGAHPDLNVLRERLAGRAPVDGRLSHSHDLGAAHQAVAVREAGVRHGRASMVAAAAVVALGLGTGGYLLGANTGDDAPGGGLAGQGDTGTPESATGSAGAMPGVAPGTSDSAMGAGGSRESSMDQSLAYGMSTARLQPGPGLSTQGGTAPVLERVAPDLDPEDFLTAWAAAQGIDGSVKTEYESSFVTDNERHLNVYASGTMFSADYNNSTIQPWCAVVMESDASGVRTESTGAATAVAPAPPDDMAVPEPAPAPPDGVAVTAPDELIDPMPADCDEQAGPPPSEQDAQEQVAAILEGTGLDAADYTLESYESGPTREVVGRDEQGGVSLSATVADDGVAYLHVELGEYTSLGDYPVISPVEAVARYGQTEFANSSTFYVNDPMPMSDGDKMSYPAPEDMPSVDLSAGDPIPFWVTDVTITQADLVQGILGIPGADGTLIPAYRLSDGEGQVFYVIALADSVLDFTP